MRIRDPGRIDGRAKIRMDVSTTLRIQTQHVRVQLKRVKPIKSLVVLRMP